MKGYDLLKGAGYIDDDLVDEALQAEVSGGISAENARPGFRERLGNALNGWSVRRRWVTAVACLAIAVIAGWGITQGGRASAPMTDQAKNAADSEIQYAGAMEEGEFEDSLAVAEAEPAEAPEADAGEPRESEPAAVAVPAEAPMAMESDEELDAVSEMIEDYPGDYSAYCYAAPAAGEVGYSMPLQDAMAEYGDAVMYRVCVEIFKNGEETPLPGDDREVAELLSMLSRDYGIVTALEKATDANGKKQVYPTLHATFDQLRRFPGDGDHGWMLYLYGEKAE